MVSDTLVPSHAVVESPEEVDKFARVIAAAFSNDALNRYLFLGLESRPDNPKLGEFDLRVQHWLPIVQTRFEKGALLIHTFDWAAAALWLPPGMKKPAPNPNAPAGVLEYLDNVDRLKKEVLGDREHWNLNLIGRSPTRSDKGAVRGLVEPFLKKAAEQGLPAWLEATNDHAKGVYTYLGFREVGRFRIGKGVVNAEGWVEPNGEGVLIYGMAAGV